MRTKDGIEIEYGHIQESWWKYQFTWNQFLGKYYYSGERLIVEHPLTAESASVMELMDGYWTQSLTEFKKFKGVISYINTDQDGKMSKMSLMFSVGLCCSSVLIYTVSCLREQLCSHSIAKCYTLSVRHCEGVLLFFGINMIYIFYISNIEQLSLNLWIWRILHLR